MFELAVSAIGGALGLLLIVNLFRWLAGVRFGHWRHIIGAYSAGFVLAILAMVSTDDQAGAGGYLLAPPLAMAIEWMLLRRRQLRGGVSGNTSDT
jgi:hypothetical protein